MTTIEVSVDDIEKSTIWQCPCPVPMTAVETAAILASKTKSARPLPSAPPLANLPAPASTCGTRLKREKQQPAKQPNDLQPLPAGASRTYQCATSPATTPKMNTIINNRKNGSMILRSGKWTPEEEMYANILIALFEEGRVDGFEQSTEGDSNKESSEEEKQPPKFRITNGMTLRAYLSRKLFCSPMRISKKFAGRGIGKLVYTSKSPSTYQRKAQRFLSSKTNDLSRPSAAHSHQWNRLKQAESNFLRVAFPDGDPIKVVGFLFLFTWFDNSWISCTSERCIAYWCNESNRFFAVCSDTDSWLSFPFVPSFRIKK
jgi:hypothetical protein